MATITQLVVAVVVVLVSMVTIIESCDEVLCASLVSKCLLLKSCECNMVDKANCTCCRDCSRCLSKLYAECCDCVGMCRPMNQNLYKNSLERASSIEELKEPMPELFRALTEEEDPEQRWTIYTYPAHLDLLYFNPHGMDTSDLDLGPEGHQIHHGTHHITLDPDTDAMNCTVAYHSPCMSLNKCKASCQSMGAVRYRWFHQHGCCECIGSTCLDYGKGEALCSQCPDDDDDTTDTGYYYEEYYNGDYYNAETNMYGEVKKDADGNGEFDHKEDSTDDKKSKNKKDGDKDKNKDFH